MADDILKNIPLPADLPENWTSGQIIAPTGAEAGLDDQHGYNYLMQQVNNAQKALKALAAQREEDLARIKFWASNDPTSPASFIGGTWEQIKDRFILAAGDTYAAGSTGGSKSHNHSIGDMFAAAYFMGAYIDSHYSGNTAWTPNYKNTIPDGISNTNTSGLIYNSGLTVYGSPTKEANNLPPYIAMYVWKRVA